MSLSGAKKNKVQDRHPGAVGPTPPNGPRPEQGKNMKFHKASLLNSKTDPDVSRFVSSLINRDRRK